MPAAGRAVSGPLAGVVVAGLVVAGLARVAGLVEQAAAATATAGAVVHGVAAATATAEVVVPEGGATECLAVRAVAAEMANSAVAATKAAGKVRARVADPVVVRVARAAPREAMREVAAWAMATMAALVATEADAPARPVAALVAAESLGDGVASEETGVVAATVGYSAARAGLAAVAGLVAVAAAEASEATAAVASARFQAQRAVAPVAAGGRAAAVPMEVRGSDPRTSGGTTHRCDVSRICWGPFDRTNRPGY